MDRDGDVANRDMRVRFSRKEIICLWTVLGLSVFILIGGSIVSIIVMFKEEESWLGKLYGLFVIYFTSFCMAILFGDVARELIELTNQDNHL